MVVFALFFLVFTYYRALDVELFEQSQRLLNVTLGLCNTLILLTSSLFVALAVRQVRHGEPGRGRILLFLAMVCGISFGVVKFFEYSQKISIGITPATNDFFMYYFMFTGIHLLHVTVGLVVLLFAIFHTRRKPAGEGVAGTRLIEAGALFWHLVDLLWVVLFALIYLMG
ncbi:hypothetical protein NSU_3647 [Novosphingobium pentaromativorans US6-1]|uniref:Heme-copper oxidase subunit III family profile domain-containing protein n=2 Tax=Novosphingobium pentaromativorans TaxID=205844 RepID=G6EH26_9SPHN|nr:hypothetical protein NSU_3647 [Novosphingobium pentaromativorans US6-1]